MRRIIAIAALVVIVAATVWVVVGGDDRAATAPNPAAGDAGGELVGASDVLMCADSITVGVVTDLSGGLSLLGTQLARGVPVGFSYWAGAEPQTGVEQRYEVDDCEIRVLIHDDQSNPEVADLAARQLVNDEGAVILIGSASPGTTSVLRDIAGELGVVLIATTDTPTGLDGVHFDPRTFLVAPTVYQDAMAICDYWNGVNATASYAQIAPDYPLGQRSAAAFRDACAFGGGEFAMDDVMAPAGTNDFAPLLGPVSGSDVLLVTWAGGSLRQLLADAAASGVDEFSTPFPSNSLLATFFADATGMTSSIAYHFTAPNNEINDYLVASTTASGSRPDIFDAVGMNASLMAVAGLRTADGSGDADALVAAFEGLRFAGPKGTVEIRPEDHIAIQDMYVVTLTSATEPDKRYYEMVTTTRPLPPCVIGADLVHRCGALPIGSLGG